MKVTHRPPEFLWLGNSPAVDFVNTEVLHEGPVEDLLRTPQDLFQWLQEAGFVRRSPESIGKELGPERSRAALSAARKYRAELRRGLAQAGRSGRVPSALVRATNRYLEVPQAVRHFDTKTQRILQEWRVSEGADVCRPIADAFASLLASGGLKRIRKCKNPDCILYYYDVSKGNTRTWCSLTICGNKIRVANFRRRKARG